jgi:peptidoglycan/LPS O-acetylase OafA/YrhL
MTASFNRKYMPEVDHLRAFAALLVLFYHGFQLIGSRLVHGSDFNLSFWVRASNPVISVIEEGHSGVALFIVLSGFILSLGAVGKAIDYRKFLTARVLRIYPMFIVCLVVAASSSPTNLTAVITSLLPLNLGEGVGGAFTSMFWAVAIEFQCYLVFPFLMAFSNARGTRFLFRVIVVALVMRLLAVLVDGASPRDLSYWTVVGRIDQFCLGMIAARWYVERDWNQLRAAWFAPAATVAFVMLWQLNRIGGFPLAATWKIASPTIEGAAWACFIVTYLAFGRMLPFWLSKPGARLGEISYSLYLMHFVVIYVIIRHGLYVQLTGNGYYDALATTLLVALPAATGIAILTYDTIELPFLGMRPKYIILPNSNSESVGKAADVSRRQDQSGGLLELPVKEGTPTERSDALYRVDDLR